MKKPELKFIRKRNVILAPDGKTVIHNYKSISQAKLFSRTHQPAGRGCGEVQVDRSADPKPPKLNFDHLRKRATPRPRKFKQGYPTKISVDQFVAAYKLGRAAGGE